MNAGLLAAMLLVTLAMAPGCLQFRSTVIEAEFLFDPPRAFEAKTSAGVDITFGGPVTVSTGSRVAVQAYELRHSRTHEGDVSSASYFLDRDFRIVARTGDCGSHSGKCVSTMWREAGQLNPDGLGYPDLVDRNDLRILGGAVTLDWKATRHDNGTLELWTLIPKEEGSRHNTVDIEETFWYEPGRPIPDSRRHQITDFVWGERIPIADAGLPSPGAPAPAPWTGLMYDDENVDHFKLGYSHRELATAVDARLGKQDDVCVARYSLDVGNATQASSPWPPNPLAPAPREERIARGHVGVLRPGALEFHSVNVHRWSSNGTTRLSFSRDTQPPSAATSLTCDELRRSPWPSMSLSAARGLADSIGISTLRLLGVSFDAAGVHSRDPARSHQLFGIQYVPEHAAEGRGYTGYQAYFEAHGPGWLHYVFAAPSDVIWKH